MTTTQQTKAFLQAADSLAGLKPAMLAEQLEISETTLRRKLRQGRQLRQAADRGTQVALCPGAGKTHTSALRICQTSAASRCPA